MKGKPVLTVQDNGMLQLDFPGWNAAEINASRDKLICWRLKPKSITTLISEPLVLAQWEAKETYPDLRVSEDDRMLLRAHVQSSKDNKIQDWAMSLYPIQRESASKLYSRKRAMLTAAPGLGKTVIALSALAQMSVPIVVIVVPLTSFDGWVSELETWYLPSLEKMYKLHTWRKWQDATPLEERHDGWTEIVLATPNVIKGIAENVASHFGTGLQGIFYDASMDGILILDESFMYQNRKAGRTDIMFDFSQNFEVIWMLSGMPVSTINDDLFSQLKILYPKSFRSYWKFVDRYCIIEDGYWGTKIVGNKPDAIERLQRELLDIVISCDYPKDIPEWEPVVYDCPMTAEQESVYLDAKLKFLVEAKKLKADKPLSIKNMISLTSRLMQIASNPLTVPGVNLNSSGKWETLLNLLPELGLPALIWVKYKATATNLTERIRSQYPLYRVGVLTGSTKPVDRYALVQAFQNGQLDILILNDVVGKYSLTLTEAKVAYYLERDFNAEAYYQSLYRARRIVSKHSVKIVLMRSTYTDGHTTIDHVVHDALLERSQNAQRLTIGQLVGSI